MAILKMLPVLFYIEKKYFEIENAFVFVLPCHALISERNLFRAEKHSASLRSSYS